MTLRAGHSLEHYRLVERIGEGGMGVVWKAEDRNLRRTVALKTLRPDLLGSDVSQKRFLREARAAASLNHPNIATVHDMGEAEGVTFIAMEHVGGESLGQMLARERLPLAEALHVAAQIAEGLACAHEAGIVHRDLKPGNVMIEADRRAKILDFGLAKLLRQPWAGDGTDPDQMATATGQLTRDGHIAGTVAYMSPEQALGKSIDTRSDVFSFGILLYELVTGRLPFHAETPMATLHAIIGDRPAPAREFDATVPPALETVLGKCLEKDPAERYRDTRDLVADLRQLAREVDSGVSHPAGEPPPAAARERPRFPAGAIGLAVAVGLALAVAIAVWLASNRRGPVLDAGTVLVVPLVAEGGESDGGFVGRSFAEALANHLAPYPELRIPPVPAALAPDEDLQSAARAARAGRVLSGSFGRTADSFRVNVQLLDTTGNRIVWGSQQTVPQDEISSAASALAREVAARLGVSQPELYDYPWSLTGSPEMARSPTLAAAVSALKQRDIPAAVAASERLTVQFPGEPDAYVYQAYAQYWKWLRGPSAAGRAALERTLTLLDSIDPANPYSGILRAFVLSEGDGRHREAIDSLSAVAPRSDISAPLRAWVLRNRATYESLVGEEQQALADVQQAVALDPLHTWNYILFARVLRRVGRLEQAIERATQARTLEPTNYTTVIEIGYALYEMGRLEQAAEQGKIACELGGDQETCAFHALCLVRLGRTRQAHALAEKVRRLPERRHGQWLLARYAVHTGDHQAALRHVRRAVELELIDPRLADDPDLQPIAGEPEFEAAIAEMKRRVGSG